jgi:ParB-like chromosome segregation protein Spo0J
MFVNVPLAELVESSTNPRRTFDAERLEELSESIRS